MSWHCRAGNFVRMILRALVPLTDFTPSQMTGDILDSNYLALTALISVGMQLFFYAIAATCKFDKVPRGAPLERLAESLFAGDGHCGDDELCPERLGHVWGAGHVLP